MRDHFNIQSGAAWKRYLRAAAFMVPPLLTMTTTQGWQGALAFTSFVAMAINWHLRQNPSSWNRTEVSNLQSTGQFNSSSRLQRVVDRVADRFEMGSIPIWHADMSRSAETDGHYILFNRQMDRTLSPGEREWIIAHELDHVRHPLDAASVTAFKAAQYALGGMGLYTLWQLSNNLAFTLQNMAVMSTTGAAFAVSFQCLKWAYYSFRQGNEFRSDTNALQNTGRLPDAISALKKASGLPPSIYDILVEPPDRMADLVKVHPHIEERFTNLRVTAAHMKEQNRHNDTLRPPQV